ncbi:aspartate aminotransferase [Fusarium longipes]|uniref:Aspartate aminotransferase n=1 Tax=Fusarium longipes TaxID=694270 RepID=A0A395T2B4_9HYPO|nr:aspartate aminotransferase [Fusarium longipes]
MAGIIQLGDAIKFAELAWTVWNYGWAKEHNAGQFITEFDFGSDVYSLHGSLKELENAVSRAQESLRDHGACDDDWLGGDRDSLLEIIGDYDATLSECYKLLENNWLYAETTGPIRNINWNISIMPHVERLRGRIQMHNSRIQHVLKPFQIDLVTNIHRDLDRRLRAMHRDVQDVKRTMNSLLRLRNPDLASKIEQEIEEQLCYVPISESLWGRLDAMLERRLSPRLPEMADCFLIHLKRATLQPQLDSNSFAKRAMKRLDELQNPRRMSHWPGYISSLEEELSDEYSRVQSQMTVPVTPTFRDEMLAFWPEDEPRTTMAQIAPLVADTCLFQGSLATLSPDISWRKIKLLRHLDSDRYFKIVETFELNTLPPRIESKEFDLDIRSAVLIPLYADPMGRNKASRPLEIIIEKNRLQHHYVFLCLQDVLAFQAAITGFKVVDGYMESHAIARFITHRPESLEDVTIQLWIPRGWTGKDDSAMNTPDRHQSRSGSFSSHQSTTTNSSSLSHGSFGSENSVTVKLQGGTIGTGYGTIRRPPRRPLLVLFTGPQGPESRRSIVAITLDECTETQMKICKCLQSLECPMTAVGSSRGWIDARRFDGDKWDLLRLAASRVDEQRRWDGLIRVSI